MQLTERIKQNYQDYIDGKINYLPFPNLGAFSSALPGISRNEVNCWTGTPASGKTSWVKYLLLHHGIKTARKLGLDYHCVYFHLEESDSQFRYSLLSNALYDKSGGKIRKNIRDFEFLGGSVKPEEFDIIEQAEKRVDLMMEHIENHDGPYNLTGIYKTIRTFARKRGTFWYQGKQLTDNEIITNAQWDNYKPNNSNEFVVIVLDHLLLCCKEKGQDTIHEALAEIVERLRSICAKKFNYCVNIIQHQNSTSENQESRKNFEILPTSNGLGKNSELSRSYLNIIGITDLNRTNANGTGQSGIQIWEGISVPKMDKYMRVVNITKNRYGPVDIKENLFMDGKVAFFELLNKSKLTDYYDKVKLLNQ